MHKDNNLKIYGRIALAAMALLLVGAIGLYRERLFADTSYIVFNIINNRSLFIQNQRFGSFITQLVPYIGVRLHLPMSFIVFSYSISFNTFFFLAAFVVIALFRQYKLGIVMACYYLLFVSDSYYLENDELLQGIAWMFLFFAALQHMAERKSNMLLLLLPFCMFGFLAFSSHFLLIIPFTFLWVYLLLDRAEWKFSWKQTVFLSLVLIGIVLFKFSLSQTQRYENAHLQNVMKMNLQTVIDAFSRPVVQIFFERCRSNYWWSVIILAWGLIDLVRQKKWLLFAWTLLSCVGYIALVGVTYFDDDRNTLQAHIEIEWQCLAILVATPFVYATLPQLKLPVGGVILSAIFITRLFYIGNLAHIFTTRVQQQEMVLAAMRKKKINKAVFYINRDLQHIYLLDWTLEFETLFLSASEQDNPQRYFFFENRDDTTKINMLRKEKGYWNVWGTTPAKDMNTDYFKIDTTSTYTIMDMSDLIK